MYFCYGFFSDPESRNTGAAFQNTTKNKCLCSFVSNFTGVPFPEIIEKHSLFLILPVPKIVQESVRSLFACVLATIFFEVARCCIGTFSRHAFGFHIIFHLAGSGRAQKEFVAGCGFCFLFVHGFGHRCAPMRSNILTVCLLMFFVFCCLVLCWHKFWSQHWFPDDIPCCGSGRNAKHIALTSRQHCQCSAVLLSLSSIPPSTPSKENYVISMVSGSALPLCSLTGVMFFRSFLGEPLRSSSHHQNLNRHHHHHRDHIINTMYLSTL